GGLAGWSPMGFSNTGTFNSSIFTVRSSWTYAGVGGFSGSCLTTGPNGGALGGGSENHYIVPVANNMVSPSISPAGRGYTDLRLRFHSIKNGRDSAGARYRVHVGTWLSIGYAGWYQWTQVYDTTKAGTGKQVETVVINLGSAYVSASDLRIRFEFTDNNTCPTCPSGLITHTVPYGEYAGWSVDNVVLEGRRPL
ncbi:MAG TPA: hypothetical protein VEI97_08465, partial [bacterium]|nr:hypothetical protein [bacterium]